MLQIFKNVLVLCFFCNPANVITHLLLPPWNIIGTISHTELDSIIHFIKSDTSGTIS